MNAGYISVQTSKTGKRGHVAIILMCDFLSTRAVSWASRALLVVLMSMPAFMTGAAATERLYSLPEILTPNEKAVLEDALRAADRGRWSYALAVTKKLDHPVPHKIIQWRHLQQGSAYANFVEITRFVQANPDWPRHYEFLKMAEEVLPVAVTPYKVVAAFAGQEPITGEGKYKLGVAYLEIGEQEIGEFWIKKAWTEHTLPPNVEKEIGRKYKKVLTQEDHERRLNRLLWYRANNAAVRMYDRVGGDAKTVAKARLRMRGTGNISASLKNVPKRLRNHPGLIYEEARLHRKAKRNAEAQRVLSKAPTDPAALVRPADWWFNRHVLIRRALEEKRFKDAYQLAADHHSVSGGDFADARFISGWLALRYLKDPQSATRHFTKLKGGVSFPISTARAHYWLGRAAEAANKTSEARQHYSQGAKLQTTFYGQLSAEKLSNNAVLDLPPSGRSTQADIERLLEKEVVQAIVLLKDLKQPKTLKVFIYDLANTLNHRWEYKALADLMMDMGELHYSVRLAKKASLKHIFLIDQAYPLRGKPEINPRLKMAEPAVVLGLSRQESEFNARAKSHAGALGIMQIMPATAKVIARRHKQPYDRNRLLSDPNYSFVLGSVHLNDLVKKFGGSYIMTAAAYNAGGSRVRDWIRTYGDPRSPRVDTLDWIENVPFSETRNYIQRVLENTQIYRNRLAGEPTPLMLSVDLGITKKPNANRFKWDDVDARVAEEWAIAARSIMDSDQIAEENPPVTVSVAEEPRVAEAPAVAVVEPVPESRGAILPAQNVPTVPADGSAEAAAQGQLAEPEPEANPYQRKRPLPKPTYASTLADLGLPKPKPVIMVDGEAIKPQPKPTADTAAAGSGVASANAAGGSL